MSKKMLRWFVIPFLKWELIITKIVWDDIFGNDPHTEYQWRFRNKKAKWGIV